MFTIQPVFLETQALATVGKSDLIVNVPWTTYGFQVLFALLLWRDSAPKYASSSEIATEIGRAREGGDWTVR
jgi:hypothetical protein